MPPIVEKTKETLAARAPKQDRSYPSELLKIEKREEFTSLKIKSF